MILLDLRPGEAGALGKTRQRFADALDQAMGIRVRREVALDLALSGQASDLDARAVAETLERARAGYGRLDCKAAAGEAARAVELLAARQAADLDDGVALRAAWTYVFLCADRDGDWAAARIAVERLHTLGVTTGSEIGVADAAWTKFPAIDAATDREIVELTVESEAGAVVWIDHVKRGTAPVTVFVPAGPHVVAAAIGSRRGATRAEATRATKATVALGDQTSEFSAIAGLVKAWRDRIEAPSAQQLARVMGTVEARFAIVLSGTETAELWALAPGEAVARRVDAGNLEESMNLAAMISEQVSAWDGRAPDPEHPLVIEDRLAKRDRDQATKWWVYAGLASAVVVGAMVIYSTEAAEDRQQIEVRW